MTGAIFQRALRDHDSAAARERLAYMRDAMTLRDRLVRRVERFERVDVPAHALAESRRDLAAVQWLLREIGKVEG